MYTLYHSKKFLLIGLVAIVLTGCGSGVNKSTTSNASNENTYNTTFNEDIELGIDNPICKKGLATQAGHIIDTKTNKGLSDATVEIAGCSVKTDENGYYKFENIKSTNRTSVNFKKYGYYTKSKIISIDKHTSNYLEFTLNRNQHKWSFNSKKGTGGGAVEISPDSIYTDSNDNNYTGDITAYYTYEDTNTPNGRDLLPGNYEGIDTNGIIVPFVSYGFMIIEINDKQKNKLNISGLITLKLNNVQGTKEDIIPLWYYNYDKGIWIEKGAAHKDENGNYICEISHTGTWSLSKPIETEMGLYRGKILDEDENPISNVRLQAIGKNWITRDLTTDENGVFEIYVVPNQTFTLAAYDYKEKYGAHFPNTLPAIASGDVAGE